MFGRKSTLRRERQDQRDLANGRAPGAEAADRSWAPDHRELRGQRDLVQQMLRGSPWYV